MKFIQELVEEVQYIKEAKDGKESLYIKGTFAQAEIGNRNKRFYPLPILEREINRYRTENVDKNHAIGELGHPPGPNVNLDKVCLLIKELNQDGNNFIGKALITSTPNGNIVKGLISDGVQLGVSTRALGSVKMRKDGLNEVQDDLKLLAVDVVADPSAPDAYVAGIYENREWIFDAVRGIWTEQVIEQHKNMLKTLSSKQIEANKITMFEEFLKTL